MPSVVKGLLFVTVHKPWQCILIKKRKELPFEQHGVFLTGVLFSGYAISGFTNMFESVHHLSRKSFQCNATSIAFILDLFQKNKVVLLLICLSLMLVTWLSFTWVFLRWGLYTNTASGINFTFRHFLPFPMFCFIAWEL